MLQRGTLFVFSALLAACVSRQPDASQSLRPKNATGPLTPSAAPAQDDGQWPMPAKDYANTRYSALDQVHLGNVKSLRLAWTFQTGQERGHEAAPLVVNNTMYYVTPFPHVLYALDPV